jgi:hypothetical protein
MACKMLGLTATMRRSVSLLFLLAVGACGSTAQTGPDGGGGSNGGGAGGITGGGGRGGGAGAVGGQSGGGGTGGCAPNQIWCPGCEPGTGACYVGGCPGIACLPDGGAGTVGSGGLSGTGGTGGRGGTTGSGGRVGSAGGAGHGGSGGGAAGAGGAAACGCTSGEICVRPSCGGTALACIAVPDGGLCPSGYTYNSFCTSIEFSSGPGPGCQPPPCTPPPSYCLAVPASCGSPVTCSCLPSNVCQGGGACGLISAGEVLCVSA